MNKKSLPKRLYYTQNEIKEYISDPIINSYIDGLNDDELKSQVEADKYNYDDKNFKIHKNNIKNNILSCRERCSKITEEYDDSFNFEACKKGCHIESPSYCTKCPNDDMFGKMFYFNDKNNPFKDNCSKSDNKKDCEKGKKYFRDIWRVNVDPKTKSYSEQPKYKMSNRNLHAAECIGENNLYKDTECDEEITLEDRYSNLLKSYKDYKTEDTGTYDNMIQTIVKLRDGNNKKTSSNIIRMDALIENNGIKEGMRNLRQVRLEDNKLLGESEMYKKIAISILGITLLLITAKKLNNL